MFVRAAVEAYAHGYLLFLDFQAAAQSQATVSGWAVAQAHIDPCRSITLNLLWLR